MPFADESGPVAVVGYRPEWPAAFGALVAQIRAALGDQAVAIDHVGSTSVPGRAAKEPLKPVRAGAALFSQAVIVLAAATAVFLLVNYTQGEGLCNPERTAVNAIVMASMVAFLGLAVVPFTVLGKRSRGVRTAALLGWTASLMPAPPAVADRRAIRSIGHPRMPDVKLGRDVRMSLS